MNANEEIIGKNIERGYMYIPRRCSNREREETTRTANIQASEIKRERGESGEYTQSGEGESERASTRWTDRESNGEGGTGREHEPGTTCASKNVGRNESPACRSRLHCFSKLARDRSLVRANGRRACVRAYVCVWWRLARQRNARLREKERESLLSRDSRAYFFSPFDQCHLVIGIISYRAREK